jgi:hypothetical protein
MHERELRISAGTELRNADPGTIEGYAAVFNSKVDLGLFVESVAPGAFGRAIRQKQDVRCLFNHDPNMILGRTTNGTLDLREDATGLRFRCTLADTSVAADVRKSILRGDVSGCSFSFVVVSDKWEWKEKHRVLTDVDLYDVGPVTYPAYKQTSVGARAEELGRAAGAAEFRSAAVTLAQARSRSMPTAAEIQALRSRLARLLRR